MFCVLVFCVLCFVFCVLMFCVLMFYVMMFYVLLTTPPRSIPYLNVNTYACHLRIWPLASGLGHPPLYHVWPMNSVVRPFEILRNAEDRKEKGNATRVRRGVVKSEAKTTIFEF